MVAFVERDTGRELFEIMLDAMISQFPLPWKLDEEGRIVDATGSFVAKSIDRPKAESIVFWANKKQGCDNVYMESGECES